MTGGAREAAIHGAVGAEVGGGGVADDLGDGVVAAVAAGGGAAGGLVVRVWPEGSGGGGESVAVMWTFGMAAEGERRREKRQGDAEAVAVEELRCVQCEGGGEGQVVHLEEHGRGRNGGVAEAGAGDGGQRRVGRKELACEVGKECVGEGVLRAAAGSGGEQADGEGAVGGGEAGAERLMRTGIPAFSGKVMVSYIFIFFDRGNLHRNIPLQGYVI